MGIGIHQGKAVFKCTREGCNLKFKTRTDLNQHKAKMCKGKAKPKPIKLLYPGAGPDGPPGMPRTPLLVKGPADVKPPRPPITFGAIPPAKRENFVAPKREKAKPTVKNEPISDLP